MRLTFCVACGEKDPDMLHNHHLLPKAEGGTDDETNLITLCVPCHGRVHGEIWRPNHELMRRSNLARRAQRLLGGKVSKLKKSPQPRKPTKAEIWARREKAIAYQAFKDVVDALRDGRELSYNQLANELNAQGMRTSTGWVWQGPTVYKKLKGIEKFFARYPEAQNWLSPRKSRMYAKDLEKAVKPPRARTRA